MLYYLATLFVEEFGALNVLTYHTVRAGAAAVTAFLFSLLFGPWIIRQLQALKIGQFIKKDHVKDLHELHKGKAGTPTMGGVMIILATLLALFLWGRLDNRLLLLSMTVFLLLGAVGFLDDYIKLKRKHNDGLSARAKFAGQIAAGLLLGTYLWFNPITVSASYVQTRDVISWTKLEHRLTLVEKKYRGDAYERIRYAVDPAIKVVIQENMQRHQQNGNGSWMKTRDRQTLLDGINSVLLQPTLYSEEQWLTKSLPQEAQQLIEEGTDTLNDHEVIRLNRLLVEHTYPGIIAKSHPNQHTKLGVPGFKNFFIPLGPLYLLFVIIVIVATSNAVNLTDGLDGLAAGASIISILTYGAIAYVVSRVDWSQYLYLTYVPEASELFVFTGALLGAGLGFLWFNAHPAEVFMGDTGSLALGGAIATLALLTKQELLLPIVAGLFVMEAGSVVIQVASYKLTGKRVFRMSPLHHHFELLGWPETKVTLRFWIIALLFALMSLATLKLR